MAMFEKGIFREDAPVLALEGRGVPPVRA